jgi:hypothetical protein
MLTLKNMADADLLRLYGSLLDELRRREVVRSANNPVADVAESLFCGAFGWTRASKEAKGHDAVDANGIKYEIKARRIAPQSRQRQVSAIRSFDGFNFLAGVLFNSDFTIRRAALVPADVVKRLATRVEHTNSWRFLLRDSVWREPGVIDVTEKLTLYLKGKAA